MAEQNTDDIKQTDALINAVIYEVNNANNVCPLCNKYIENNQPKTDLMCNHTYHTSCFLTELWLNDYLQNECKVCHEHIFSQQRRIDAQEIRDQRREVKNKERLEKFQTNKAAVGDLKLIKKQIRITKKARTNLQRFMITQKREHKEESEQLSKLLKDMVKKRKKNVITSDTYKEWKKEKMRLLRYIYVFNRKYPTMEYSRLAEIPQLKMPSRWGLNNIVRFYSHRFYRYFR